MASKRSRWIDELAAALEDQGCRVRSGSKSRYVIYPPRGGIFSLHSSPSDHRYIRNLRKTVEQHGLTWPTVKHPL